MDVPMTDKPTYADECLARASRATPGPWKANGNEVKPIFCDCCAWCSETAEFIAHARTDVVELAKRLKKACDELRAAIPRIEDGFMWYEKELLALAERLEAPPREGET